MLKLKINETDVEVEEGLTVLQACEKVGVEIPRFCYHEKLSIAGNCRMCLVEMEKSPKPIASCAMPVSEGMNIKTNTSFVEKARKGVMEFLLANHPLDCPVCDQGGECDLQDQSMFYGIDKSRYKENKRYVPEKYMGPLIKTQMTRCIHCTRCIRFATEVAGVSELGAIGRGEDMQITTYLEKSMESELSANVIDLCPVGALTSKPYTFEARPWELKKTETIDVMDAVGSNIRVDTYGWEVKRVLPRINEDINEEWISDKTRYACDGLKNQRLDTPYLKIQNTLKKTTWENAYKIITEQIKEISSEKIAGLTGDLTNMETLFIVKEFFSKTIKSKNLDSRSDMRYVNNSQRENYIFNSTINGIEDSDLIILIGTNPRYEATILNSRIRKSFLKNNTLIYSLGNLGELNYPYKIIKNDTETIKNIVENNHELSDIIKKSKKPIIILGQSILKLKSGKYIFEEIKKYLKKINKINKEWNSLNIISNNAATVGSYDLDILSSNIGKNLTLEKIKNNDFQILFLFGQDDLKFKTIDGNDIGLDLIISYRIIPEKAPYIVANVAQSDLELRTKIVRVIARSLPRDIFGELQTEAFYKSELRAEKSVKAKALLNEILNPYGVIVEKVLTKDYRFNREYQQAIEDKKVADQQTEKLRSEVLAKQEEYKRKLERAKGEVFKDIAKADGDYEQAKIAADVYYIQQQNIAKAIQQEGKAEAQGIQKLNEALAEQGGKIMVKLEMAKALKDKGAKDVYVYITHAVLSGHAVQKIEKSVIKKLITTDTIDNSQKTKGSKKIEIISLAPMISEAMKRIANSTSVSSLFK